MVAVFLRAAGWKVVDMGNDVAPADFVAAAVRHGARVIGVSAMMLTTAENIRAVREELDARGLSGRIRLAVGGAVFKLRPELVSEVGGDGTAPSAIQAPALFDILWDAMQ
jgi:methanogenic corrinoid protein MtbC1